MTVLWDVVLCAVLEFAHVSEVITTMDSDDEGSTHL
jgi:hypothetical protein